MGLADKDRDDLIVVLYICTNPTPTVTGPPCVMHGLLIVANV